MSDVLEQMCPKIQETCDFGAHDFVGALRAAFPVRGMQPPFLTLVPAKECAFGTNGNFQPAEHAGGRDESAGTGRRSGALSSQAQLARLPTGSTSVTNQFLEFANARFVALVEGRLFDPFAADQSCPHQNL